MSWTDAQELVTLKQAKQHLKLPLDVHDEDDDMKLKLLAAHALVMHYVTQRVSGGTAWEATVDAWTEDTAPKQVLAAILVQFGELYRSRGDDVRQEHPMGTLHPYVVSLLYRLRDPAMA